MFGRATIRLGIGPHSSLMIIITLLSLLLRSQERLRSIVVSASVCVIVCVCLSVSLSVCPTGCLRNHMRDLYQFFVHVAYVRFSALLRHVYDRPHRLSPRSDFLRH